MKENFSVKQASIKRASQDLRVGGFIPLTSIDFPGKLAAVVFCQGCPWRCSYCHNKHLLDANFSENHSWQSIKMFLSKRRGLLDGVVFSGGEPTMQNCLKTAILEIKEMGFSVGLHTAGMFPNNLKKVLPFVDWVGMDIKAPLGKSSLISNVASDLKDINVKKSIQLILESSVKSEFRTTFCTDLLSSGDIETIRNDLVALGASNYKIQECRPA